MARRPPRPEKALLSGTRRWVEVPRGLVSVATASHACTAWCPGCASLRLDRPRSRRSAASYAGISDLAYGQGAALKILLALLWQQDFLLWKTRFLESDGNHAWRPDRQWLMSTGFQGSIASLAATAYGIAKGPSSAWTTQPAELQLRKGRRALSMLTRRGLIESVADPGHANTYFPHVGGAQVALPAWLWREGWVQRLDGPSLLMLVFVLGQVPRHIGELDKRWRYRPRALRRWITDRLFVIDFNILKSAPLPTRKRHDALWSLASAGLVLELRSRSKRFLALTDSRDAP
jgi:hypothetical protein